MARRKVTYPPAKTANRPPPATGLPTDAPYVRPTVATIDTTAAKGRAGLKVGGRVRISGGGLYAGEIAVIERLVTGVIPAAVVRTEAGKTRQVRTIDLEPVGAAAPASPAAPPSPASAPPVAEPAPAEQAPAD
jgi:hypothetical protein